jgi:hypothetical protein
MRGEHILDATIQRIDFRIRGLECGLHKATNVFGDVELICKGHAVPGGDWEDLVLAVTVAGRPFNFRTFSPAAKVEDLFPALVGDSELAA